MQINGSIVAILVIACFLGIKAIAVNTIEQEIINIPPYPIYTLCGGMGAICQTSNDCCSVYPCYYSNGYNYTNTRCCGVEGALGCAMAPSPNGKGCCVGYYCDYTDATKKTTRCNVILK